MGEEKIEERRGEERKGELVFNNKSTTGGYLIPAT
jgi:hypothetical protein